jgi:hypothetical protein
VKAVVSMSSGFRLSHARVLALHPSVMILSVFSGIDTHHPS